MIVKWPLTTIMMRAPHHVDVKKEKESIKVTPKRRCAVFLKNAN